MLKRQGLHTHNHVTTLILTSVAINKNLFVPSHVWMIILVTNGHSQCAGYCLSWIATVTHDNGDQKLFLPFSVKHPESRQCCCAIEIILEVEVVAVVILHGHCEVEGRSVVCRVPVHSSEQH